MSSSDTTTSAIIKDNNMNYPDDIRCYDHNPRSPFYKPDYCAGCERFDSEEQWCYKHKRKAEGTDEACGYFEKVDMEDYADYVTWYDNGDYL